MDVCSIDPSKSTMAVGTEKKATNVTSNEKEERLDGGGSLGLGKIAIGIDFDVDTKEMEFCDEGSIEWRKLMVEIDRMECGRSMRCSCGWMRNGLLGQGKLCLCRTLASLLRKLQCRIEH